MKALSIKQPWATLIAIGTKPVENRSRNTNYRGRIYLHSSGQPMRGAPRDIIGHHRWDTLSDSEKELTWDAMKLNGAIIGEATISDCVQEHSSIWADPRCYQWVLSDVVLYEQPIMGVKGMLGLWNHENPFDVIGSAELVII